MPTAIGYMVHWADADQHGADKMKIFTLTSLGANLAATPSDDHSVAMRILYFMRRNHGRASDEQLSAQLGLDGMSLRLAMNELMRKRAVECRVST